MADNKKITPLNVPKVKRGVKGALTPGEQPEKEQTPIEKVISRELTKIVEDINFDAKFESIKTAIESRHSESLLPVLEKINDKLNPILGALYGVSNVDNNTNTSALLSKLGNLNPKLTMFSSVNSLLESIYDILIAKEKSESSNKHGDSAIVMSAKKANYDFIIESINDSTNSIIDIISEKTDDIIGPIKKLVNTNDFNLRTAQIIDAINSSFIQEKESKSEQTLNTKVLQYDVNINASGLDKDTVESLIDLSKISVDSTNYLANLDNIVSSLSNLEVLNDVKLNNKNIKNIADSINALSKMDLKENTFNPLSVDNFKYFIDALSSIDLSNIKNFDEDSLKSISVIIDILSSFSKLELENFNKNIQSLNVEEFVKLLNNLKDIPVYDKEKNDTTFTAISELFSAISSISGFDETKFDNLSSNLSKIIRLTENSSKGLIRTLINNIDEISSETKETSGKAKNISEMLNVICNISKYDDEEFENLKDITEILVEVTNKNEPYLYRVFQNLKEIGDFISGWDTKNGPSASIREQLKIINGFSSNISLKSAFSLGIKSTIMLMSLYSLSEMFNRLKIAMESSKNANEYVKIINESLTLINSIESIDTKKIENLNEGLKLLIVSSMYFRILALISSKEIDISNNIKILNNVVEQLNSLKDVKSKDNLESLNDSIKSVLILNIWLAIVGITMPLAYIGAFAIDKEITVLNNVVEQLNSLKEVKCKDNLESLNDSIKNILTINIWLAIVGITMPLAFIGAFAIDKEITILNNVVEQLNSLKEVKGKDNLKPLSDSIKSIGTLNIWLAIVGITMPLAFIGAFAIDKEISMLSKIVGKINEIEPVKKDVINNLKSLAIVIVAASSVLVLGALVGGFVSTHLLEILGFTIALSAFIFLTIGAFNIATRGMEEAKLNAGQFGMLLLISTGIMLLGGAIMTMYLPLVKGSLAFSVALGAFILLTIGALNIATDGMGDAITNAKEFAILIGTCAAVMLLGGLIVTMYTPLLLGSLVFTGLLSLFILTTIGALNLATQGMNEAAKNAKEFAILIGVCAATMFIGGLIILNYPKIILGSLGFSLLLGAFIFLTIGALNLATKGMKKAAKNAKEFAIIIGVCAATMLIGGLFMLIPGMPLTVLEFAGIFVLFLGITLFAYALASKHIKNAKEAAIGFGVVVLLTSIALLLGGGMFIAFPGLDIECLKFAGISALFIAIFGVTIWELSKLEKKDLIKGELALAGIAVIIAGFGYAFTFVAEAMDMMSKVKDPWTQLGIMGTVFVAMVVLVAGVVALTTTTGGIGAAAIAAAEGLIAGVVGIIWLVGKAMSAIAQSMIDLDKVKDFDSKNVIEAISNYISLIPELMPLASPKILISMLAVKSSVGSMSEAILAIATSVKAVCDLKTEDGRQLTSSDFTLAAENVKSVVTILGRSLIDIYKENKDMFSAGTIGDLLGMDTPFSRVAKSCSTMGKLITDISAGVKDFAELRMPIYDENGNIKGYREMTETDFETAGKSIGQVVTCLGGALINIYKESPEMFAWRLIGDNPFAMVSKSCLTMGKLITDISAGVKDFAELRMPIYDENGKIKGYREMNTVDFINAGINIGLVLTCLANAIMAVYNDPNNKDMFTDPSNWHTSADKTPFGMVTKAMGGVGTLVKDGAAAIKEIADMKVDFKDLEGENGKVAKIVSILASSILGIYNKHPELFTDDSFWHTDPQKTPFGMVMQCLNTLTPFVKSAASSVNEISKMNFKASDLAKNGEIYLKINRLVSVIPKAIIDLIKGSYGEYLTDDDYIETYENMGTMYTHFSNIISSAASAYNTILKLDFKDSSIDVINQSMWKMLKALPETIIGELNRNKEFYSNTSQLNNAINAFTMYNNVIDQVAKAYNSIIKSLAQIGVSGNDTSVIDTITNNLNTMISKLSTAIRLSSISLDPVALNLFSTNVSSFYSSIDTLTRAYKLIPDDLSNYDNVIKAIEGVNFKIAEIQNLEAFEREQQSLEKYIITLNNLDLTKVEALSNLMSIMNELATKLGALDNFTATLNDKISVTLSKLANQIKISGDIINKADSLQKKRHEAIKDSIKEIQSIMHQRLIVEVNHNAIQSNGGGFFTDSYDSGNYSGNVDNGNIETPVENNKPSMFERASNAITNYFGGNDSSTSKKNTPNAPHPSKTIGGIDYEKLKEVIVAAITQASGPGIDINRNS